jgi:arylformamidase
MKIIDLTVPLYDGLQSFPGHPKITVIDFVSHAFSASRYIAPCRGFASKLVVMSDHGGTHLDAPFHFFEDGLTIDEVPLEKTVGEAVFIDVSDKKHDKVITAAMLEKRLKKDHSEVRQDDIVLIRAWDGEWNGPGFHNVAGLGLSAAKWLTERKVKAVGVDLSNADTTSDMSRPSHMQLLGNAIGIMENLVNLDKLTKKRFFFAGIPLKIKGLSGSPIRAIAIEEW